MRLTFIIFEGPPKIGGITSWILNIKKSTSVDCLIFEGNYWEKIIKLSSTIIHSYFKKDILVCGDFVSQCITYLLFFPRSRVIFVHHGPGTYKFTTFKNTFSALKNNIKGILHKRIFCSSVKHVFVSERCLELISKKHEVKIRNYKIIYNGFPKLPEEKFKNGPSLNKTCLKLIYAGRDHPLKNVDKVYKISILISEYIPCKLFLCGVERKFKDIKGLEVFSLGDLSHEKTKELIKSSDIAIFLSDFPEANPLFLIESMHFGLGILCNTNKGSLETLKDYPTFIVPSIIKNINYQKFSDYLKINRKCFSRTCLDQVKEIRDYANYGS